MKPKHIKGVLMSEINKVVIPKVGLSRIFEKCL